MKTTIYQKLDSKMKEIVRLYFLSLKETNNESIKSEDPIYSSIINRVSLAFNKLECFEKMIINNDYFYLGNSTWWTQFCNEEYYLKRKKRAMEMFLRFMNYAA